MRVISTQGSAGCLWQIDTEVARWAGQNENRQKMLSMGLDIGGGTPARYGAIPASGYRMIGEIVKSVGIQP